MEHYCQFSSSRPKLIIEKNYKYHFNRISDTPVFLYICFTIIYFYQILHSNRSTSVSCSMHENEDIFFYI